MENFLNVVESIASRKSFRRSKDLKAMSGPTSNPLLSIFFLYFDSPPINFGVQVDTLVFDIVSFLLVPEKTSIQFLKKTKDRKTSRAKKQENILAPF